MHVLGVYHRVFKCLLVSLGKQETRASEIHKVMNEGKTSFHLLVICFRDNTEKKNSTSLE